MMTQWYNILTGEIVEIPFENALKGVPIELIPYPLPEPSGKTYLYESK